MVHAVWQNSCSVDNAVVLSEVVFILRWEQSELVTISTALTVLKKDYYYKYVDSGLSFIPEAGDAGVNSSVKGLYLFICVAFPFQ